MDHFTRIGDIQCRRILAGISAAVYACDADGYLTVFNDAAANLWGRSPKIGIEKWCGSLRIYYPDGSDMPLTDCPMAIALRDGVPVTGREIVVERPDGTRRHVLPHPQPLFDDSGVLVGAVNMLVDITDRKRLEARDHFLLRLDDAIRQLGDPDRIILAAATLLREHLSAQRCSYAQVDVGQDRFDIMGESVDGAPSMVGRHTISQFSKACLERLRLGEPFIVEDAEQDPQCAERLDAYRAASVRSIICFPLHKNGEFVAAMSVHTTGPRTWRTDEIELVRTVTGRCWESIERALVTRTLRESESRFRLMADAAPAMIWMSATDKRCTWFNKRWLEFVGQSMEDAVHAPAASYVHPDDLAACQKISRQAFDGRIPFIMEFRLRRHDGEYRWILDHGVPRVGNDGAFAGYIGSCIDITDRKTAEQTLAQRERYLRAVIETTPECVKIVADDGTIRYMNPAGRKIMGAEPDSDLVGTSVYKLIAPESRDSYIEMHERVCAGERQLLDFDITGLRGNRRHMQTQAVPLHNADGTVDHLAITRDVTERVEVEIALRESENRFRMLAENISQFAWTADPSGSIHWYNQRWYDYTGTTFEQMQGGGWKAVHHPEYVDRVTEKFQRHIEAGEPWEDLFPIRGQDGGYRWFLSRARPIRDDQDRVVQWFGTNTDVTEHREAEQALERYKNELEHRVEERTQELRASHERLRLSERMASLGTLSAGLGHDMGNLLVPLRVCVEMLEQADLDPEHRDHVMEIKTSAEYLQQLAAGLRLMAIDPDRVRATESIDLRAWWREAAPVMKAALPKGIRLEADFPNQCWARISPATLTQAVFNLVQNAGSAMSERGSGTVRIASRCEEGIAVLTVEDDGPGMTPEVRNRCMEPFFTTKPRGISTGLGLVLVAGLVRDSGGSVELSSEPGKGTKFIIRLPSCSSQDDGADDQPMRGRAAVLMNDPRLHAFVAGELRAMRFEVTDGRSDTRPLDLAVVERGVEVNGTLDRAREVVLIGDGESDGHASSGCTVCAKPSSIREALQRFAQDRPGQEDDE